VTAMNCEKVITVLILFLYDPAYLSSEDAEIPGKHGFNAISFYFLFVSMVRLNRSHDKITKKNNSMEWRPDSGC
jgi:hypothetical protein